MSTTTTGTGATPAARTHGEVLAEDFFGGKGSETRITEGELSVLLQTAFEMGQRAHPQGQPGDAIDRAAEALTEAMRLVAEAGRAVAESADTSGRATTVDDDDLKDLKEAIEQWGAASEAALKAIHEGSRS